MESGNAFMQYGSGVDRAMCTHCLEHVPTCSCSFWCPVYWPRVCIPSNIHFRWVGDLTGTHVNVRVAPGCRSPGTSGKIVSAGTPHRVRGLQWYIPPCNMLVNMGRLHAVNEAMQQVYLRSRQSACHTFRVVLMNVRVH